MESEYAVLQLTNPLKFQDTTVMSGSSYVTAKRSKEYGATKYFSGYAFRGDKRPPQIIFEQGFMLQLPVTGMHQIVRMTGSAIRGFTGSDGISTAVCVQVAANYAVGLKDKGNGFVYLIDAMNMNGFVVAQHEDSRSIFRIRKKISEVCFP